MLWRPLNDAVRRAWLSSPRGTDTLRRIEGVAGVEAGAILYLKTLARHAPSTNLLACLALFWAAQLTVFAYLLHVAESSWCGLGSAAASAVAAPAAPSLSSACARETSWSGTLSITRALGVICEISFSTSGVDAFPAPETLLGRLAVAAAVLVRVVMEAGCVALVLVRAGMRAEQTTALNLVLRELRREQLQVALCVCAYARARCVSERVRARLRACVRECVRARGLY